MKKEFFRKMGATALAGALMCSLTMPVLAASSSDTNSTAINNALSASDIIDASKSGSISIYKYDSTTAAKDGVWENNDDGTVTISVDGEDYTILSTGETNTTAESALSDYAIQGVVFSYVYLGEVETYSYTSGSSTTVNLVYEIDSELAEILGLDENDAYDMTAEGVANTCDSSNLHYDSTQLADALADLLESGNTAAKDALEAYAAAHITGAFDETDENGYTTVSNLDLGLYLIVETSVPENVTTTVDPWFVTLPFTNISDSDMGATDSDDETVGQTWLYDAVCYPKNQTGNPTLDKLVRNAYGSIDTQGDDTVNSYDTSLVVSTLDDIVSSDDESAFVEDRNNTEATDEYAFSDTTTASEGDVLDYILVSKLPTITSTATYLSEYTFTDKLSAGLTYNKDAVVAIYDSEDAANLNNLSEAVLVMDLSNTEISNNSNAVDSDVTTVLYAQDYVNANFYLDPDSTTGETVLTLSFTKEGLALINTGVAQSSDIADYGDLEGGEIVLNENGYGNYYIVISYTATVNSDAQVVLGDDGNANEVTLEWSRTNTNYTDTLEDKSEVYTYGIDLTKYFSDGATDYSNVQFILYNQTDGYYVVADSVDSSSNTYYVGSTDGSTLGKTTDRSSATIFTPSASGNILIYGLEADTYELIEIQTESGYTLLSDSIVIDIETATKEITAAIAGDSTTDKVEMAEGDVVSATATVNAVATTLTADATSSENAIVNIEVTNNKTSLFPFTGGYGTLLYTLVGCFAAVAGIFLVSKKKKEDEEEVQA